jgi:Rha family phage regulatory protein
MVNLALQQTQQLTLDSREVAKMIGKEHKNLLRDIETYIDYLEKSGELKIEPSEFFQPSTYISEQNKKLPSYQITKKGCEFIAHKLTGPKGAQFTATYINYFHEMEQALTGIYNGHPVSITKEEQEKLFIQKQRAEAMLINARTRQAKLILEMQKTGNLSPIAVELLGINALEALTGKQTDYRPEVEKTYSATEIANAIGVTSAKVGRTANQHNLKTPEYGITVLDKSPHSNKQVSSFRYNERGKQRLLELLKGDEGK